MATPQVEWQGLSGKKYTFYVYPLNTVFDPVPANYIFAKVNSGTWAAIYIGETDNLQNRLASHEKWSCAKRHGATHVHAHKSSTDATVRRAEEQDLIAARDPPCNLE